MCRGTTAIRRAREFQMSSQQTSLMTQLPAETDIDYSNYQPLSVLIK